MNAVSSRAVIIIGGGIGGLAAAAALQRAGIACALYERADALREVGSGLVLWPNAFRALDYLGLSEAIRAAGESFTETAIRTWRGDYLVGPFSFGGAQTLIHRAALLDILLQAVDSNCIHLNCCCVGYRQDAQSATALFADGQEATGAAIICADGIHSVLRTQLAHDSPMRYAGYAVWRGIADFTLDQTIGTETWGSGAQFGVHAAAHEQVYWYATNSCAADAPCHIEGNQAELLHRFRGWHEPIEAILAATDDNHIIRTDIYDRAPLESWCDGRVALLGDAAHATTPNLGQGACLALEDGVVLSKRLAQGFDNDPVDIPTALHAYETQRIARTTVIQRRSRRLGQISQLRHPLLCGARNMVAYRIPKAILERQMRWLFEPDLDME